MPLTLGWYYHLPPCATPQELRLAVDESLLLLIDAHERVEAKVSLALTGAFLSRIEGAHDRVLAQLREGIAAGRIELLASTFYEVCPFLVPPRYLRRQVELDLSLKERLFGVRAEVFWPGNLAWAPVLPLVLGDLGLRGVVIGEAHLREAQQTQLWRWLQSEQLQMQTVLRDTWLDDSTHCAAHELHLDGRRTLRVAVVDSALRRGLSFGTSGAIHHAWDNQVLDAQVERMRAFPASACVLSGDDGDRINPVSIHQYRRLLEEVGPDLRTLSESLAAREVVTRSLEFLPAHAPGGMAFWRDEVASAWLATLEDLYRAADSGSVSVDEVLPLQDVFPMFWKRIARARWFHQQAWTLLRKARRAPSG
jgi:hypothetical protein